MLILFKRTKFFSAPNATLRIQWKGMGCAVLQIPLKCSSFYMGGDTIWARTPTWKLGMYRIFTSMPNSGQNSVFVFGRIVSLERIYELLVCIVQLVTSLSQCQMLLLRPPDYGRRMKGRGSWPDSMQIAGTAVINEGHKEVVNIRTAGAASKFSAINAIHIRILIWPNSSQNYSYSAE